jgi:hypothetical protein
VGAIRLTGADLDTDGACIEGKRLRRLAMAEGEQRLCGLDRSHRIGAIESGDQGSDSGEAVLSGDVVGVLRIAHMWPPGELLLLLATLKA